MGSGHKRILRAVPRKLAQKKKRRWKKRIWKKETDEVCPSAGNLWSSSKDGLESLWPAPAGREYKPPSRLKTRLKKSG